MRLNRNAVHHVGSGLRKLGQVSRRFNNSSLGKVASINPKIALVGKALEKSADIGRGIHAGLAGYEKAKEEFKKMKLEDDEEFD